MAIRGSPAKGVGREIDARVRISPTPPITNHAYAHSCKRNTIGVLENLKISGLYDWDDENDQSSKRSILRVVTESLPESIWSMFLWKWRTKFAGIAQLAEQRTCNA